ncbi:hypothetical protein [Enterococcus mundtii]|uniref:hypothetical protein n=1 Tax=Enterococcus mundtii TaxID=53346 RepID=UPI000AD7DC94|nr:hypothetical protein [Enterococcus mundtii]
MIKSEIFTLSVTISMLSSGEASTSSLATSDMTGLYVREVWNDSWRVHHGMQYRTR